MRKIVTTMTQRGQVTVPAEVRRLLGLKRGDKVEFAIENGEVKVARPRFTIETVFGSVPPLTRTEDFEKISREARDEKAERDLQRQGFK